MRIWLINELLLWLIVANGTPLVIALIAGSFGNRPVDYGIRLVEGRPLFGASKTVRGLAGAIIASTLVAPLFGYGYLTGCLFGGLAMLGDLLSSFTKRRLGYRPGCALPLLDQVPETALPLVLLQPVTGASALEILVIIAGFTLIDLLVSRVIKPDQPVCR